MTHDIHSSTYISITASGVVEDGHAEFTQWYNEVHVPAIVAHPAIYGGSRYQALDGDQAYLAIYSMADEDVSSSPELKQVGGWDAVEEHLRSVWSRRYRRTWTSRHEDPAVAERSEFIRATWLDPKSDRDAADFEAWYQGERLPLILGTEGVISAARYVCLNGEPRLLTLYELDDPEAVGDLDLPGAFNFLKTGCSRVYRRVFTLRHREPAVVGDAARD